MNEHEITLQPDSIAEEIQESAQLEIQESDSDLYSMSESVTSVPVEAKEEFSEEIAMEQSITSTSNADMIVEKPFAVMLYQKDMQANGNFVPDAAIHIRPSLRSCGLLQELSGEEVKSLLLLFTFLTPNGSITPSIFELGEAFGESPEKVKEKMKKLLSTRWQGSPIVTSMLRENGMDAYTPTRHLVSYVLVSSNPATSSGFRPAGRDRVIAHSRSRYTRPRTEVERQIAIQNGWPMPEESESTSSSSINHTPLTATQSLEYLRQRLFRVGLMKDEVELLLGSYPSEHIE